MTSEIAMSEHEGVAMKKGIQLFAAIVIVCLGACSGGNGGGAQPDPQPPIDPPLAADEVRTAEGVYKGAIEGNLRVFRGLRYAAPPVGNLRFRAPTPPTSFTGTNDATTFKSNCFQPAGGGSVGEEDCLFLNLWSHNDDTIRPVLVFLHGGGSNNIGGNLSTSIGTALAENGDIIVATMNRRMNVFGALATDELVLESGTAGNYALQDVQAAMRWLRDNVGQFNGDPNRIMLVGESSGASLLCHVLSSPGTAGLISAAAIQSAGCGVRVRLNDSIPIATPFDNALNLHRPITDNEFGGSFGGPSPVDDAEYRTWLTNIFGSPQDDQIYAIYPTADFASVADAWRVFRSDWIFNCVAEELARSASGNTPAYLYNFSRGFSTGSLAGQGAVHAIDVPFLFETYELFGHTPDADDAAVTDAMQNAWTGLASDPTAAPPYLPSGASSWPAFDINAIQVVNFNAPTTIDTTHREGRCVLLRDIISL
jgi:carboxylesterase type B